MTTVKCGKCDHEYFVTEVGDFKCSICGNTLPGAPDTDVNTDAEEIPGADKKNCNAMRITAAVLAVVLTGIGIAGGIAGYYSSRPAAGDVQKSSGEKTEEAPHDTSLEESKPLPVQSNDAVPEKKPVIKYPAPDRYTVILPGNLEVDFRLIKAGSFTMGSPENERGRKTNEEQHEVTLTEDYYMGVTEVTQAQYYAITRKNPSLVKAGDAPVVYVSWNDAVTFCNILNKRGYAPRGWKFTLPTEAQWEYACRAGSKTAYSWGGRIEDGRAHYKNGRRRRVLHPQKVKHSEANAWGLFDMHGNVREWCLDFYGDYPVSAVTDPQGAESGGRIVCRGGGWDSDDINCRSAYRSYRKAGYSDNDLGFRMVLIPE